MKKMLSVAAIENGTVIDHIPSGQAMRIVELLDLAKHKMIVTLGLNLPSKSMGFKDIIKVEEREITESEASQIALFAPSATLCIIRNFQLAAKIPVKMPEKVRAILRCPNERCVTNFENLDTCFRVVHLGKKVEVCCSFCEKSFTHDVI